MGRWVSALVAVGCSFALTGGCSGHKNGEVVVCKSPDAGPEACEVVGHENGSWVCQPPVVPEIEKAPPVEDVVLRRASGCVELGSVSRNALVLSMRESLRQSLVSAYTTNCYPCYAPDPNPHQRFDAGTSQPPPTGNQGASSYSQTNVQVAGVDEPDFVKNDGRFLYQATPDGRLTILQAWPAASTKVVSVLDVGVPVQKLFLAGDRVVTLSYETSGGGCTYGRDCEFAGQGFQVVASVVDVTNRAAPVLERQVRVPSGYLSARRIGEVVHLVTVTGQAPGPALTYWPKNLVISVPQCGQAPREILDFDDIRARFEELEAENLAVIDRYVADFASPMGAVIDQRHTATGVQESRQPIDCASIEYSPAGDGSSLLSVVSFGIADAQMPQVASVYGRPGAVYGSAQALYVGVRHWWDANGPRTDVHKFQIQPDGRSVKYAASGSVPGMVINQFAMDEKDGYLRVATTIGWRTSSSVTVLGEQAGKLAVVGAVEGIAPGEDIRSVRFDGATGYVVTFRQTDPLFVLDLADPTKPVVEGELEIPGFSTYIHKLDAGHLLTIGYETVSGWTSVILQVFDVTDKTAPALLHKVNIAAGWSDSEAAKNHLAFNYFAPLNVLAIPVADCGYGSVEGWKRFNGLLVFDVSVQGGIRERGGIPFDANDACWWSGSISAVQRSAILEDFVFAIAPAEVKVSALADLANPVADVKLAAY